jgi:hypothetical protein
MTEFLNTLVSKVLLNYLTFQIIGTFINMKINVSPSLSQAFIIHKPNFFAVTLSLSEGRAGRA